MCDVGSFSAVAHVDFDVDLSPAWSVDEVPVSNGSMLVEMHSNAVKSSDAVVCLGVNVAYLGHGPSVENVFPV